MERRKNQTSNYPYPDRRTSSLHIPETLPSTPSNLTEEVHPQLEENFSHLHQLGEIVLSRAGDLFVKITHSIRYPRFFISLIFSFLISTIALPEGEFSISQICILSSLLMIFQLVSFQYFKKFTLNRGIRLSPKDIAVMGVVLTCVVLLIKISALFTEDLILAHYGKNILPLQRDFFWLATPLAAGPMMVGLLISSGEVVWLFTSFMTLLVGVLSQGSLPLICLTLVGGLTAARSVHLCKRRNDIYWAGVLTGLVNSVLIVLLLTLSPPATASASASSSLSFLLGVGGLLGLLGGLFSALITLMWIPLVESVFNYTTDLKLMELSSLNHPLLKEMMMKAPGTYHHSIMVGSLVEPAAQEIGANPLLARVMSYYHDIGKMEHPQYFIENHNHRGLHRHHQTSQDHDDQESPHSHKNPHDQISPHMSRSILLAHVKDGLVIGKKHRLGKPILDGIAQHHGTTTMAYFYHKALEKTGEGGGSVVEPTRTQRSNDPNGSNGPLSLVGGGSSVHDEIIEEEFKYPGPRPRSREAALVMLADSIEAASRSLDDPTPMRLMNLTRTIIHKKFFEAQLEECNLTLRDLFKIENSFKRTLCSIYHQRPPYPTKPTIAPEARR